MNPPIQMDIEDQVRRAMVMDPPRPALLEIKSVMDAIVAADLKRNAKQGWNSNSLMGWYRVLAQTGSVEVGYRTCCGCTHSTMIDYREWMKIVRKLERAGVKLSVEAVKHKNAYATINGGFWNSNIYRLVP